MVRRKLSELTNMLNLLEEAKDSYQIRSPDRSMVGRVRVGGSVLLSPLSGKGAIECQESFSQLKNK